MQLAAMPAGALNAVSATLISIPVSRALQLETPACSVRRDHEETVDRSVLGFSLVDDRVGSRADIWARPPQLSDPERGHPFLRAYEYTP